MTAIARDPSARYQSVGSLAEAMDAEIARLGVSVPCGVGTGADSAFGVTVEAPAEVAADVPAEAPAEMEVPEEAETVAAQESTPEAESEVEIMGSTVPTAAAVALWGALAAAGWALSHYAL